MNLKLTKKLQDFNNEKLKKVLFKAILLLSDKNYKLWKTEKHEIIVFM